VPRRDAAAVLLTVAIAVALAVPALRTGMELRRFATSAPELPLWDEAKYGLDGARLAAAIERLDVPHAAALVYGLDVWPPLFPVLESSVFLAAGNGFAVARELVAVMFVLLVAATFWAGREIAPESPPVAAIAAALVIASPFVQLFAVQAMLEVPGMLLYVLSFAAYARFLRLGGRRWIVATGVLSAALFFVKYNYGLLWLAPLLANEAWIACGGARAALGRGVGVVRRIDPRRPFTLFVLLYLAALAVIAMTGGGTLRVGGAAVSVTGIGNPLAVLIAIVLVRALMRPRRAGRRFRAWERGVAERNRVLLWTAGVPIAIWLLLPPHLRGFVDFVENRSAGPPIASLEGLLFYPRVFVVEYHAARWLGTVAGLLALGAIVRRRETPAPRTTLLAVLIALLALTLHPYKEPRFLLIAAPVLWLAAAWNAATLAEAALAKLRVPRAGSSGGLAIAAAIAVLGLLAAAPSPSPSLRASFSRYTVGADARPMLDHVVDVAARRPTLVLGTWNQASPALIEWRFLQLRAAQGDHVAAAIPEWVVPSRRGGSAERILSRLDQAHAPERIVMLEVDPPTAPSPEWAAAFAAETAWLEPVRRALDGGSAPYALASDEGFTGAGYRVRVFDRVASGDLLVPRSGRDQPDALEPPRVGAL
jgi:hypothetical protein